MFKSLKVNSEILKYIKNTNWYLLENIIRLILGMLISVWVARYLGPSLFGSFMYVIAISAG